MHVRGEFGDGGMCLNQRIAEFQRVRGHVADAADAFDGGDAAEQFREIHHLTQVVATAVGEIGRAHV